MKGKLFLALLFLYTMSLSAREGMWLPFLLEQVNEKDMRSMGMKISAKDIYDVNAGSLKDAVVIFGGGCTGEVVSKQGLVLTNHHCGYGTVQGLSSLKNNYLLQGFWARNRQEELPCPGLSVTFIIRIDDVTAKVKQGVNYSLHDTAVSRQVQANITRIEKETEQQTGYLAQVKSFYYDNTYYLFLMERFTDIRLVGFPPNGIGKFGGDTDNWAWPRHTGDFGLFRIYAGAHNKPAAYSPQNQPFVPRRSLKINIGGTREHDFTMVYGFPGRTSEYLTSDGVEEVMNILDPARIRIREQRLNIMEEAMRSDPAVFIQYASKQSSVANYYKKWKGELLGLQLNNAIEKKKAEEAAFRQWVNYNDERQMKYGHVLDEIAATYRENLNSTRLNEYINEAIWPSEVLRKGSLLSAILSVTDTIPVLDSLVKYERDLQQFHKSIHFNTDRATARALFAMYAADLGGSDWIATSNQDRIYEQSFVSSPSRFAELLQVKDRNDIKAIILKDPGYKTYQYFDSLQKANTRQLRLGVLKLNRLYGLYIQGLQEFRKDRQFYPDANSTMRVAYGRVEGVKPQDGMTYTHFTTLDGAVRKADPDKEEFRMPDKLLRLYEQKDYGRYSIMQDGKPTVPLAFLASNHTTGGNSGSPVLNARGELIGTNFDRIWEGTMSDIMFDPNLCRNISLDVRYTLFIIEKFGDARWVVDEMELVK